MGAFAEAPAPKPEEKAPAKADTRKNDPFVIYHINKSTPVVLRDDYGVMLTNPGWEENPSPHFIIALKQGRTLIETDDPKVAARALRIIPKGSSIRWYDSCSCPRSWGLPASVRDNFETAIKDAGLKLLEHPDITCYCPDAKPLQPAEQ